MSGRLVVQGVNAGGAKFLAQAGGNIGVAIWRI